MASTRLLLAALALLPALLLACGSDSPAAPGGVTGTPPGRPASVPAAAEAVGQTRTLGEIVRRANVEPQGRDTRRLDDASCQNGVLVLATSEETVYGGLDCGGFWTPDFEQLFEGTDVALQLEVSGGRYRILVETLPGAQAEFTVSAIWLD